MYQEIRKNSEILTNPTYFKSHCKDVKDSKPIRIIKVLYVKDNQK